MESLSYGTRVCDAELPEDYQGKVIAAFKRYCGGQPYGRMLPHVTVLWDDGRITACRADAVTRGGGS